MASGALALAIVLVLAVVATRTAQAQTLTTLHSFDGTDGAFPEAALVQGADGNFYGTTWAGGAGGGTVFKITPSGVVTALYSFCSQGGCPDGANPRAVLVHATDGNFYGTTFGGPIGEGTVFKITPGGKLTTLHHFCSQPNCADGLDPLAGLIQGTDGNFYGTTSYGGANGWGTVFQLTPEGTLTTLYSFVDDVGAGAPLMQATNGDLYGTTAGGGRYGAGTIFEITPGGTLTTLYNFTGPDGSLPVAGLVQGTDGNFYGTTFVGGASGLGTVFKITPGGTLTTLYNFCSQPNCADGAYLRAGLVQGTDGNFYGTTLYGGANNNSTLCNNSGCGTIFKITPEGALATLYSFCSKSGCTDGTFTGAGLMQATNGTFYGATVSGGTNNYGTVFSLGVTKTTTTLSSSPNPSTYGQAVTFIAAVTSKLGAPPDGETVTFMRCTKVLGTGVLSGGSASFTTSTLPMHGNLIKAVYGGDSNFAGSASKWSKQVVSKAATTTALVSSQNPSSFGQSVTFTASVSPQSSGTLTGMMVFYDGATILGSKVVKGGVTELTTKKLTSGQHTITATYGGSRGFTGSSASLVQTVN